MLKVDFRNPKGTNSGIFLRTPAEPKDPASDCYELNIADRNGQPVSDRQLRQARERPKAITTAAEWRTFTVRPKGAISSSSSTASRCSTTSIPSRWAAA